MALDLQPAVLVGLIGAGIQASRAPALHEREGAEQGLRYVYKLIDLDQLTLDPGALPELLTAAERLGFAGLNITHPCKQSVLPLLTDLSEDARALGAVNTVLFRDRKRVGHNTDWWGFAESFRRGLPGARLNRVALLGAGGAGAAVAYAALKLGAQRVSLFDLNTTRAAELSDRLSAIFGRGKAVASSDLVEAMSEADGVIHATPTGMAKYPGLPLPEQLLHSALWVAEVVYFPLETELLGVARRIGCRTLDGGGMAVFQAVEAFRLFTERQPNPERMLRHFAALG
jgi:quinate/shikimate dehydrogenase (NAD+)